MNQLANQNLQTSINHKSNRPNRKTAPRQRHPLPASTSPTPTAAVTAPEAPVASADQHRKSNIKIKLKIFQILFDFNPSTRKFRDNSSLRWKRRKSGQQHQLRCLRRRKTDWTLTPTQKTSRTRSRIRNRFTLMLSENFDSTEFNLLFRCRAMEASHLAWVSRLD